MAILGSGVQARSHPEALCRANTFQEVRAGSPQPSLWVPVDRICGKWIRPFASAHDCGFGDRRTCRGRKILRKEFESGALPRYTLPASRDK